MICKLLVAIFICLVAHSSCAPLITTDGPPLNSDLKIVKWEPTSEEIPYKPGLQLTCVANASHPVYWRWVRISAEGNEIKLGGTLPHFENPGEKSTTISLGPTDDPKDQYVCRAYRRLDDGPEVEHSFWVVKPVLPPNRSDWYWLVVTLPISLPVLAVLAVILGLLLWMLFGRKLKKPLPEEADPEDVKKFLEGEALVISSPERVEEGEENVELMERDRPEPYHSLAYDPNWELGRADFWVGRHLSSGHFGKVHIATLRDKQNKSRKDVVIKMLKYDKDKSKEEMNLAYRDFLNEIKLMAYLSDHHKNVVAFVGANTEGLSVYGAYLLVEYCGGGDLEACLRKHRNRGSFQDDIRNGHLPRSPRENNESILRLSTLVKWALDLASGLEYIESRRLIHRDVAARNVLLAYEGLNSEADNCAEMEPSGFTAKIADFGISRSSENEDPLSRSHYYGDAEEDRRRKLPVRWLSLESLLRLEFSHKSDVWSLGVVFWEMFSLGQYPYLDDVPDDISGSEQRYQLTMFLRNGNILAEPDHVPYPELWDLMTSCWEKEPEDRPTFGEIREVLEGLQQEEQDDDQVPENAQGEGAIARVPYCTWGGTVGGGSN